MSDADRLTPLIKRRTWRDRDPLPRLLREWYGRAVSPGVILARLPHAVTLAEAVDQVMARIVSPEELLLHQLRQDWSAVVGEPIAKVSEPHHLHQGVLYISVQGATMRMELSRFHQETILARVKAHSGDGLCHQLRFTATG